LLGAKFKIKVFTDHRNLLYTLGGKIGNQRQHRWHLFFQEYDFELIYRQGKKNGKPDSLSRRPDYQKGDIEDKPEFILDSKNIGKIPCLISITNDLLNNIKINLKNDKVAEDLRIYFSENNLLNDGPLKYFVKPSARLNSDLM